VIAIRPRHPVVPGHVLVIPHAHVADVGGDAAVSARAMMCAAELAGELPSANVITSKGSPATQTVFHLHLHVVPRADADGLPLPWTPQHAAQRLAARQATSTPAGDGGVNVVWAREPIPAGPSVFLAGPTPRSSSVPSWRPAAIEALAAAWTGPGPLTVLTPESRGGKRAREYHDQVEWEAHGLDTATAILFWIPRDVVTLPGFTTNVEFGLHVGSGRVVLGAPPDCPNPERNRYLAWTAQRLGVPVYSALDETVAGALGLVSGVRA
jgi:diadenosine tetraphosphate (Ap4A) HIT family hydrolase